MQSIDVNQIVVSKQNIRPNLEEIKVSSKDDETTHQDTDIGTLAQSIKSQGLLNPILVRPISQNRYEVYAGQRRLAAVKRLNWETVPCMVSTISDRDAKVRSLIENYQRRDNTNTEKIRAFCDLYQNECNQEIKSVCQAVGTNPATLKRYLRLGMLPEYVLALLEGAEKRLTLKNAELLVEMDDQTRRALVNEITRVDLSNFETEFVIRQLLKTPDLSKIQDFINKAIDESAKRRTQRKADKTAKKEAVEVSNSENDGDVSSEKDDESERRDVDKKQKKEEDDEEKKSLVGEIVDTKVNKARQPWIYDPSDKLKKPIAIPDEHLALFWKLYQKVKPV